MRNSFILFATLTISFTANAGNYDKQILRSSKKVGVPYELLSAICFAESRHQPWAYNPDDPTGGAFGICQVLPPTAWQYLKKDSRCIQNEFKRGDRKNNNYHNCKLFGPLTNSHAAAKYLKYQLKVNNGDWLAAIAGYNSGTAKHCQGNWVVRFSNGKRLYKSKSKCQNKQGQFINQSYVNRVLKALGNNR